MMRNQTRPHQRQGRQNRVYQGNTKPSHIPSRNRRRTVGDRWRNDYLSTRGTSTHRHEPRRTAGRGRGRPRPKKLDPIHISKSSIHNDWKSKYGGLIRYYVDYIKTKNNFTSINNDLIMEDVYKIYIRNGCNLERMRDEILKLIDYTKGELFDRKDGDGWIDFCIVVEDDGEISGEKSFDNKGIKLKSEETSGGHVVKIPNWAVGKSYYFEVMNRSPCDLSCEISIDGISKAAKNAPIPAKSRRTIKPDSSRYFEKHKWSFMPSQRISLQNCQFTEEDTKVVRVTQAQSKRKGKRYNGVRPDYENKRVSYEDYPDPTSYGWTFTGSCANSKVEFFDKVLNMGTVKLDFYYTTGTVKTVLLHPSTGLNQLFRKCGVLPNLYKEILANPRVHTGIGYRTVTDFNTAEPPLPSNNNVVIKLEDDDDDFDVQDNDVAMENNDENNVDDTQNMNFFAKNDNYDFKTQGHINRQTELQKAMEQPGSQFNAWCKAANTDWSCVTAKFYISISETKRRTLKQNNTHSANNHHNAPEKEPLPAMTPIADIKSNENVTLSTKFQPLLDNAISNSNLSFPSDRPVLSSNVRMRRVNGLTDDPSSTKSEPLFEYKLFYRAVESNEPHEEDNDDMMEEEEDNVAIEEDSDPNYYQELKSAKLNQIQMYHNEYVDKYDNLTAQEVQDANNQLNKFIRLLMECDSSNKGDALDGIVKEYFDWNMKMQWDQSQRSLSGSD